METPQRYPLAWPVAIPRKSHRKRASFGRRASNGRWDEKKPLTIAQAFQRLEDELNRMGAEEVILSTNIELTLSGRPRADRGEPADPGAALYFKLRGKPIALPCDTYDRAADNIAALAKHIEATRAISRFGVSTLEQAFAGFTALPPPIAGEPKRTWRQVFGIASVDSVNIGAISVLYRQLAKEYAADEAKLLELNIARDEAREELGNVG